MSKKGYEVIDKVSNYRFQRIFGSIVISKEKKELLFSYGWYRNATGGYAHPHGIDHMSAKEIRGYNLEQLEYKLQHGSEAALPSHLRGNGGRKEDDQREHDFMDGEMV